MWNCWRNENWQGKQKYAETASSSVTSCTINQTWSDLGSNMDYRGEKLATKRLSRPYHSSGCQSPASHSGGPGSVLDQVVCCLPWTKWHWGRFPLPSVIHISCHLGWYKKLNCGRCIEWTEVSPRNLSSGKADLSYDYLLRLWPGLIWAEAPAVLTGERHSPERVLRLSASWRRLQNKENTSLN